LPRIAAADAVAEGLQCLEKDGPRLFCWLASLIFFASNDYFIAAMEFARPAAAGQNAL
jgi:hypothetical protein